MRINNNLVAMNTSRMAGVVAKKVSGAIQKLSSGMRINHAGDDVAGLAISEKMRAQIRGLNMASRNAQDAVSLIQTVEGATNEVHDILQRMRQLSVQASNDTAADADRQAIQSEIDQLNEEVNRIANTTSFNGISVLDGSGGSKTITQTVVNSLTAAIPAYIDDAMDQIEANFSINTPAGVRNLDVTYYYDEGTSTGASMGTADGGANLTMRINLANVTDAGGNLHPQGVIDTLIAHEMMHGYQFTNMAFSTDGVDRDKENWFLEGLSMAIQGGNNFAVTDHNVALTSSFDGDYRSAYEAVKTLHEITDGGINAIIDRLEAGDNLDQAINNTTQDFAGTELAGAAGAADFTSVNEFITWFNADAGGDVTTYLTGSTDFSAGTGVITNGGVKGSSSNLTLDQTIANDAATVKATTSFNINFTNPTFSAGGNLSMQVGANSSDTFTIQLANVTTDNLGTTSLDLTTTAGATNAINSLDSAIESVSSIRGRMGAYQNRLEHTIKNLEVTSHNLQAAESQIRDVDMANAMMSFTKNNILGQAAQAMLAQANQSNQGVLQLLRA